MAVPAPSRTAATAQAVKVSAAATMARAAAWVSMPVMMKGLRPYRSDRAPVTSCPRPQTAGYSAGEDADLGDGDPGGGEEHREQPPGQAVVEVVDQPGLAGRGQCGFAVSYTHLTLPTKRI